MTLEPLGTALPASLLEGAEQAIIALGSGFLSHPANHALRTSLQSASLTPLQYYRQLLCMVYRLLFLFVAEDRDLLLDPHAPVSARERYLQHHSLSRLRRLAGNRHSSPRGSLYQDLQSTISPLSAGCPELALPAIGSFLFSPDATLNLNSCQIANLSLLDAIHALAFMPEDEAHRPIDFKSLPSEALGSLYESLLERHPQPDANSGAFTLLTAAGSQRKTSGSYYTPDSLVQCLLDSTVEPLMDAGVSGQGVSDFSPLSTAHSPLTTAASRLRALKLCDPSCGAGRFLIAAGHRLAKRLASATTGDPDPSPEAMRAALCEVIENCLYGVDIDPMAVELCKIALWMEMAEPGRPLSCLNHHIRCGNSLLGATPALIHAGIPEAAFTPVEGDDREFVAELKRQHKKEFGEDAPGPRDDCGDVACYSRLCHDAWCAAFIWEKRRDADIPFPLTNSAFQALKHSPENISQPVVAGIERLAAEYRFFHWRLAFPEVFKAAESPAGQEENHPGWSGGFDVILGNPPWEKFTVADEEWFAAREPGIAAVKGKARRDRMIADLAASNPSLYAAYRRAKRDEQIFTKTLTRESGLYPLTGFRELNTYPLFAEAAARLISPTGRVGLIVKTGIGSAENCLPLFKRLAERKQLISLYDFVNRKPFFPAVQAVERFSLLTFTGSAGSTESIRFATLCREVEDLSRPGRQYALSAGDIALMSPINGACPLLKTARDAEIMRMIYQRFPVLARQSPDAPGRFWNALFVPLFHMSGDSGAFKKREEFEGMGALPDPAHRIHTADEEYWPLYEGKYLYLMDHRYGSFENVPPAKRYGRKAEAPNPSEAQLRSGAYEILPRYWFPKSRWLIRAAQKDLRTDFHFLFRDVAGAYPDHRTAIGAICPAGPAGDKAPSITLQSVGRPDADACRLLAFASLFCSVVFDYIVRNKLFSKSLKWNTLGQIPMPPPEHLASYGFLENGNGQVIPVRRLKPAAIKDTKSACADSMPAAGSLSENASPLLTPEKPSAGTAGIGIAHMLACALELTYTSDTLNSLGNALGVSRPFVWDAERRFILLREIDACAAHLYGISREEFAHILDSFETLAGSERSTRRYGEYRTKRVCLENYDAMAHAITTGASYHSRLSPPPASGWQPSEEALQAAFPRPRD